MKPIHAVLVFGGALVAYFFYKKNAIANPPPLTMGSNPQNAQPSQLYPWQATQPPRVDNKNQPWYNNDRTFMSGPSSDLAGLAADLKASGSIVQSLGDIWGNMSDWFGGNDAKSNLIASPDDYSGFDVDSAILGFGDEFSQWDQSYADNLYDEGMSYA